MASSLQITTNWIPLSSTSEGVGEPILSPSVVCISLPERQWNVANSISGNSSPCIQTNQTLKIKHTTEIKLLNSLQRCIKLHGCFRSGMSPQKNTEKQRVSTTQTPRWGQHHKQSWSGCITFKYATCINIIIFLVKILVHADALD